jgi:AcrR family transcriptional regulator
MDDIAQQAGVAKATVYLRWKTREELFVALLQRERVAWAEEIKQRIHDDPEGLTLRGIFKHTALALIHHPLMRADLMRDREVLGKLAHLEQSTASDAERLMGLTTFLEVLRAQHLVRTDFSLRAQVYLLSTIFAGSFLVAPLIPEAFTLADEELADLMAETVSCTLEADRTGPPGAFQHASRAFLQYLDRTITLYKHAFSEEEKQA